ncbi:MAG: type II secretion system F family protein [Candidatus Diapherotrites archaeon]|nr:type II secretion system F family protein [Candidatus Diapherotrites archaeon]
MYERIASMLPASLLLKINEKLVYAGISMEAKRFAGFMVLYTGLLCAGIALNLRYFFFLPEIVTFPVLFLFLLGLTYFWLTLIAENNARFAEKVLPDALQLVSSNIRSGLTTERALFISARPEFGPLCIALQETSKKIMVGIRVENALLEIPQTISSKVLERTLWLISKGITSGGQIADLLEQLADDLRNQNVMREEIRANISMYVLLIFFAAALGAPILFGITTFIVQILNAQTGALPSLDGINSSGGMARLGIASGLMTQSGSAAGVTPEFISFFTTLLLLMTALFSSLTIGVINTGKESDGLKKFPVIALIAFAVFYFVQFILHTMFSGLIG